ncbi:MAG: DNA polymerase, partial [Candidatus Nanohaloarchaea archaeon]|nr:DNA polymerase [Candidatus Nanohaloarchaea archaeon]
MESVDATLLDADYVIEEGEAVVRLFAVDGEGEPLIARDDSFDPYFYAIPSEGLEGAMESVENVSEVDGDPVEVSTERVRRTVGREEREVLKVILR